MTKLKELADSNEIAVDPLTLIKIEGLLRHKQEIDDKALYEDVT